MAFTVVATLGITAILPAALASATPHTAAPAKPAASAATDPPDDGSVSDEDEALQQAESTGQPAEVVSARTQLSDEWANPDGTFSVKRYGTPVRMWRNGAWVATDPTLMFNPDGTVVPKASTVAVTFSGGGTGPLLSGVKDGRTLTLSWPSALPVPTLDGNVATYSEILPGVDLQLKAEVEGFSQLIVVKTAEAAQNPALATLRYTMSTVGLSVATDPGNGSVAASDPAGETVFTSPTPLMWDSTTATSGTSSPNRARAARAAAPEDAAPADAFEPPPGSQDAQMATSVSGDTLSITPDQQLLTGASTQYPVYIDPSWAWGNRQNWTRVYKKYPNTSFWNANEVARVGYENETYGLSRSFFQMDTSNIEGADVISSTFRIKNVWSWSCQARPVEIWQTGAISKNTTWNHQPGKVGGSALDTVNDARGWSGDCAAANLEFDLTPKIRALAHSSVPVPYITLGLYASDEGDTYGWKKFDPKTAVLETKYNHPPKTPSNLGTNPKSDCAKGGLIGNTSISLHATIDDQDGGNLSAGFQLFAAGSSTPVVNKTIPANKGRVATLVLPDSATPTGSYTWKVIATDHDGAQSGWSRTCTFSVDRTRPGKPPVINSAVFPPGDDGWPAGTGAARSTGDFTLAPNGVSDVQEYGWYTDYDPAVNYTKVASGGTATVQVTPPGVGPHFVYAFSRDAAGNRSDTATYVYYAAGSGVRDTPGDLNGDGSQDIWTLDSNGTLLTYAAQGSGDFSAATNGGLALEGAQIASDGDWGQDGYNDLLALQPAVTGGGKELWEYPNNGSGIASTEAIDGGAQQLTVACPVQTEPTDEDPTGCATGDDHWHDADQIIAPGDLNLDGAPDLMVKEGSFMWLYYGDRASKRLDMYGGPVLLGGNDWDKYTVLPAGDLNSDLFPDLLLRDNATGDVYQRYGRGLLDGFLNLATWADHSNMTKVAGGITAADYPVIGIADDLTSDQYLDLWGRKSDNTMTVWTGVSTDFGYTFGTPFTMDGTSGGIRIPGGTTISPGKSYSSRSAKLTMGADGNLTVTSNAGSTLWSTNTGGHSGATAIMQSNGDFVVYDSDGVTRLWDSGTSSPGGYALLQDRGNFVVYNVKGQSLWAAGTEVRNDYNGDGRSDMAAWYDYADTTRGFVTFAGNSDGTLAGPVKAYTSQPGSWNTSKMKFVSGDFNGDGRSDIAEAYDYGGGVLKVFTALATASGGFGTPTVSWATTTGWYLQNMTLQAGDFNGDGRDDLAVWYAYSAGEDTLFTFTANVHGGFNAPFPSWTNSDNGWNVAQMKFTTGDFNGDGRDDLAALYGYSDGHVTMFSFLTNPTGGFQGSLPSWTSTTWGDWNRTHIQAGDSNGDSRDDVYAWYDYADGHDTLHTLLSLANRTGGFGSPTSSWTSPAGNFDYDHTKMTSGDFNGDGRDDLAALYGYVDGTNTVRTFSWLGTSTGGFAGAYRGWSSTAWTWSNFHFVNRYN